MLIVLLFVVLAALQKEPRNLFPFASHSLSSALQQHHLPSLRAAIALTILHSILHARCLGCVSRSGAAAALRCSCAARCPLMSRRWLQGEGQREKRAEEWVE